jgi:hypothetical protein
MLIMAVHDLKAGARPSVRNEPKSGSLAFPYLQRYPLNPEQVEQLTDEERLAGTLFALTVVEGLLEYSEVYKRHYRGKPNPASLWPLIPAQVRGLHAALLHLSEFIGTLRPEPGRSRPAI